MLFFLCFSPLFSHQTYAGRWKKMFKEKNKRTGSVFQTTWPTNASSLCRAQSVFYYLLFFYFQMMIKLNSFQSPRYESLAYPGSWPFFVGNERSRLFSTYQHCELAEIVRLNWKLYRVFEFKSKTHRAFTKTRPQYSQQGPSSAISTGGMMALGSPWPYPLAEDCRLIIARRHWIFLKAFTNVHEWKASCFLNNEWFETLIQSNPLLPSDYAEGESFYPSSWQ